MLRRFIPLLACLVLAIFVLLARLWDVQVVQHNVWATEAANIVRSYGVEPYTRGTIRDRNGDPIVRDEKRYVLEFVWRDFRRGHPLGQVAMLRSLARARPVGLDEARQGLVRAARDYAMLTPNQLKDFADGKELDVGVDYVPAIAAETERQRKNLARAARRRPRAGDMRFYILRLLQLTSREAKDLQELVDDEKRGDLTYVELAGLVKDVRISDIVDQLEQDVSSRDEQLARLAGLVAWGADEGDAADGSAARLEGMTQGNRLVRLIEGRRRDVDDETADALFRIALGFSPDRLDERNLAALDLEWLRAALDWDQTRLGEWRESRGGSFVNKTRAGFVIARSKRPLEESRDPDDGRGGDRLVSALAHAFRADAYAWESKHSMPEDWRRVDELEVLKTLGSRLARGGDIRDDVQDAVFLFQDEGMRTAPKEQAELVELLFQPVLDQAPVEIEVRSRAKRLVELASSSRGEWNADDATLAESLLDSMNGRLQQRVAEVLADLAATESVDDGGRSGVAVAESSIERAMETRRYVVRDRGARPKKVGQEPSIDLVLLVTRYRREFAGFRARATTRRIPTAFGPDGEQLIASKLIGGVRSPFLVDVLQQRAKSDRLIELQRKRELPEEDAREILKLVDATRRPGEAVGGSGLEAWFDLELAGKSGYHEVQGLQDRVEGNRAPIYRGAIDGLDLTLTLDIGLQRAAEDVISNPLPPVPDDPKRDTRWYRHPVGAIVLATVDGEILAAASAPRVPGAESVPGHPEFAEFELTDGERAKTSDRTLTRPYGQPPGSVVKPLLAAYALEHLGLEASAGVQVCENDGQRGGLVTKVQKNGTSAGYGMVDCWSPGGHSPAFGGRKMDLFGALKVSCNTYFAALAERWFDGESIRAAYRTFGFGEETGVRYRAEDTRRFGLLDSYWINPQSALHDSRPADGITAGARHYLGNGLKLVDANVVQVARAYAGLATGELPEMRLVKEIGGKPVPSRSRSLRIGRQHLDVVRGALDPVVHEFGGSAYRADLREEAIGFHLVAKTGSADYRLGRIQENAYDPLEEATEGMRKHTWLAGWFPSSDPRFVVVIYLHDTSTTSSHSAVYVAKQFLQRPEVQALMAAETQDGASPAQPVEASASISPR